MDSGAPGKWPPIMPAALTAMFAMGVILRRALAGDWLTVAVVLGVTAAVLVTYAILWHFVSLWLED